MDAQSIPTGSDEDEKRARAKAYKAAYYQANKEIAKERSRARYAAADKDVLREQAAARRQRNIDAYRASNRAWKKNNPDRVKELDAKYRANNKEKIAESNRQWRLRHLDERKAKEAQFRKDNKESENARLVQWRRDNPEKSLHQLHRRRARLRAAEGSHTVEETREIRLAQKGRCAYCRVHLKGKGHLDHIVALSKGGSNRASNLQWLCVGCNQSKSARDAIEFARTMGKLL